MIKNKKVKEDGAVTELKKYLEANREKAYEFAILNIMNKVILQFQRKMNGQVKPNGTTCLRR